MADPNSLPLDPRLQANLLDLYGMANDRMARTEPIHQAAMAMAQHMAPGYAQSAMTAPRARTDPNSIVSTGANGGGGGTNAMTALASALAGLGGGGNGAGFNIGDLIKKLIDLFRHHQNTVQGDKPFAGGALMGPSASDPSLFAGWPGMGPDFGPTTPEPTPRVDVGYDFPDFNDYEPGGSQFVGPMPSGGGSTGRPDDPYSP